MMNNLQNMRLQVKGRHRKPSSKFIKGGKFTIAKKTIPVDSIKLSGAIGSKIIIGLPDDTPIFNMNVKGAMHDVFFR